MQGLIKRYKCKTWIRSGMRSESWGQGRPSTLWNEALNFPAVSPHYTVTSTYIVNVSLERHEQLLVNAAGKAVGDPILGMCVTAHS